MIFFLNFKNYLKCQYCQYSNTKHLKIDPDFSYYYNRLNCLYVYI
jgi:hypothetical protein